VRWNCSVEELGDDGAEVVRVCQVRHVRSAGDGDLRGVGHDLCEAFDDRGRSRTRRELWLGTEGLVELTRIELVTSSMPWKRSTN
jgi:hypothetical protein